jgi:tetratricopeptide (TPR) repeat protein
LSGDRPDERSQTLRLIGELGLAYLDTGHYTEAIVLYRDLISRDPGERTCDYQVRIVEATAALRSGDKEAIERELMRQLEVEKGFVRQSHPDRKKLECSNRTAELLSETAMAWHLEAVGSGGVRGTLDPKTMARAERLYRAVLASFDRAAFARFEFPRIVRQDWPTRGRLAHARADLLYEQGRFQECGPAYAEVAAEDPQGKDTPSALYGSAVCWQKAFGQKHAGGAHLRGRGLGPAEPARQTTWERLQPKALSSEQRSMIEAFDRFLCMVKPPRAAGEAFDRYVEVKFARARTYFEAQHWDEAAAGFRDVALNHPTHDAGIYAGHLWLEAVNVLGTHAEPKRSGCLDALGEAVAAISSRYCDGERARGKEELCQPLVQVQCDVSRKRAEKLVAEADSGSSKNPLELYARAADQLLALYRKFGEAPLRAGGQPLCRGMDEVVYNMAKAYQAAHLLAKAIEARLILVDSGSRFSETPLAKRALYELGQNYQAIAVYGRAALFYERYAAATRYSGEHADRALSDAVVLRLGLGDAQQALENARIFEQRFGRKKPERSAEIALALSNHHGERNDWAAARRVLEAALPRIAERADYDVRIQAHALLGRAQSQLGRARDAARHYDEVRSLWGDGARAVAAIERAEPDAALRERRIGRAVTAVGEALYFAAEARRAELERLRFPVYRGPGTKADVLKHIQGEVKSWIGEKRPLVEQATADYKKILDIQPAAPPVWVVAAGARVGEMWATFASELRSAPVPDSIRKQQELYQAYINGIEQVTAPQQLMARQAFETCTSWSVKYQYSDALSRKCEEWLARNYKAEYHLIDEFRGAPNRSSSPLRERAPALDLPVGAPAKRR